jgi:hypothetical protein
MEESFALADTGVSGVRSWPAFFSANFQRIVLIFFQLRECSPSCLTTQLSLSMYQRFLRNSIENFNDPLFEVLPGCALVVRLRKRGDAIRAWWRASIISLWNSCLAVSAEIWIEIRGWQDMFYRCDTCKSFNVMTCPLLAKFRHLHHWSLTRLTQQW